MYLNWILGLTTFGFIVTNGKYSHFVLWEVVMITVRYLLLNFPVKLLPFPCFRKLTVVFSKCHTWVNMSWHYRVTSLWSIACLYLSDLFFYYELLIIYFEFKRGIFDYIRVFLHCCCPTKNCITSIEPSQDKNLPSWFIFFKGHCFATFKSWFPTFSVLTL